VSETVYYDGSCALCHRLVLLTLRLDRRGHFRFAPLHGETFRANIAPESAAALPDSIVVQTIDGKLLIRSLALAHIFQRSGWPVLAWPLLVLPRSLADRLYDWVAVRRKRWFAPPTDVCPVVPQHLRSRFLR
jgi:predicted DCC family thiol-disulfide oxidoreductase YuxK